MVASEGNIAGVALQSRNERLGRVIPNLDGLVVRSGEEVGLIGGRVVIDVVDTLCLVGLQSEVGVGGAKVPDLDGSVQTSRCKSVGILRVNRHAHDIVAVTLEDLNTLPTLLPIPKLDCHVIGGSKDERLSRVDSN